MASNGKKRKKPKSSSSDHTLLPVEPFLNSLPSSKADFIRLIAVVSIAGAVAVACNFVATSLSQPPKPFCDNTDSDTDGSLFVASDYCEPCPENGVCYDGKLECDQGYKKHGKLCVEDEDVDETAKKLSKWVEVRLCEAYAQLLCSGTGKCWVSEDELFDNLDKYYSGLDKAIYMPAKLRVIGTIHNLFEKRKDNHGVEEFRCPELLVNHYKPFSCVVQQWLIKHALLSLLTCALLVGCILIAFRAYQRYHLSVRAEQLYNEVCDILEEKPLVSERISGECEPWVVASWLRDHLLLPKERKNRSLWKKVEELVQEDSRIDQYPKFIKGESVVVWEWQVAGSLRSFRKEKKMMDMHQN